MARLHYLKDAKLEKRDFLKASAVLAALPSASQAATPKHFSHGPVLLTVVGAIGRGNRGPLDPAFDQMMKKQGMKFERAHAFDFAALSALPSVSIKPTLEYDGKSHAVVGPLMIDVLIAAGATLNDKTKLVLRAVDGYAVIVSIADVRKYRYIVATMVDNRPLSIGGLGPLWAVFDADRFDDMKAKPLNERFASCPWGLYSIEVQ